MRPAWVLWCAVASCGCVALAQESRPTFSNPVGWKWALAPQSLSEQEREGHFSGTAGDVAFTFDRTGDTLRLELSGKTPRRGWLQDDEYRGVVFDARGQRFTVRFGTTHSDPQGWRQSRSLPAEELSPADARFAGIEVLTPAGRKEQSRDALRRAREAGVEVLPLPVVGERYDFRLTTLGDGVVSNERWRGKVVLIDGWATWCNPCMQKMPELRELYEKWHAQGFEVLAVNFDQELDRAQTAISKHGLTWPQAYVPADDSTRTLWDHASSFMPLPRLVLLGRDGIVAAVCSPAELKEKITALMGAPTTQPARTP